MLYLPTQIRFSNGERVTCNNNFRLARDQAMQRFSLEGHSLLKKKRTIIVKKTNNFQHVERHIAMLNIT